MFQWSDLSAREDAYTHSTGGVNALSCRGASTRSGWALHRVPPSLPRHTPLSHLLVSFFTVISINGYITLIFISSLTCRRIERKKTKRFWMAKDSQFPKIFQWGGFLDSWLSPGSIEQPFLSHHPHSLALHHSEHLVLTASLGTQFNRCMCSSCWQVLEMSQPSRL